MLVLVGNGEKVEDQEKNEKIVDAQGNFENITGNEFQRNLASLPEIKQNREPGSQGNVDRAQAERSAKADNVARAVEEAKIGQQHAQREKVEENPEIEQWDSWQ